MKISQVEVIPLVRTLSQAFEGGTYRVVNRYTIVTRVHCDTGLTGEVFGGDEDHTQSEIVALIRDHFAPMLVGEDPRDVERLWAKMFHSNIDLGNRGLHMLDMHNRGILMQAIAAVDNAIWDLLGKIYGAPLYKLLGGTRDRVPVIAIGGYYKSADGSGGDPIRDEIEYYRELGLAGMKFKVGRATIAEDIERVTRARAAAGDDFIIACDANQAWTPQQAIAFCKGVEPLDIEWMEEPVRWYDQLEGLRRVAASTSIPINAGQGEISAFGCRDLVTHDAVSILNVDCTIAGGVTEWRRIAAFAHLFHIRMAHHEEPQIALHLLAAAPNGLYVEIFPSYERDPMWVDLIVEHPRIAAGYMELPEGPGIGLQLNEEVIDKYRIH
ncbi:MAG: mandelate racemase/muconate lactonizing enzyme family protein [Chloroflexi bacterium]|nr:mandelate racemase/muconate lactonizing enzyme family protein [Chloroflexota bacterium]